MELLNVLRDPGFIAVRMVFWRFTAHQSSAALESNSLRSLLLESNNSVSSGNVEETSKSGHGCIGAQIWKILTT